MSNSIANCSLALSHRLVVDDTLYFIFDAVFVVKYNQNGTCEYVQNIPLSPSDVYILSSINLLYVVLHRGTHTNTTLILV